MEILRMLTAGLLFLESDLLRNFTAAIAGSTYKLNRKELQLSFFNQLFLDLEQSKRISVTKIVQVIKKLKFSLEQDFLKSLVQKPIENIERLTEQSKSNRKTNKKETY